MCIFCSNSFPLDYQIIKCFDKWFFVHDINPMRSFHCLLVFKKHISWFEDICDSDITKFWEILKECILCIKKSDINIKSISVLSLNLWEKSKHLHFHLIPIFNNDNIRSINNIFIDWSWINFLWNKEIIQDSYKKHIVNIYWKYSNKILWDMELFLRKIIAEKVKILKSNI